MTELLPKCKRHLQTLIVAAETLPDGAFWPSILDTRTGRRPVEEPVPQRVYRLIGAPRGSTLYWDQPMIVAARALAELTGDPSYAEAANAYVDAFLSRCVAENGMFRWGNHAYYDLDRREVVEFQGGHHELRPITPDLDLFSNRAPEKTAAYVRALLQRHVYDPETGGFNRHDDGRKGHAFLEAGGILCESAAWLHAKTGDATLLETALRIARYSFSHRDPVTGLVPNEPDMGRWDSRVCTSEIGLWAQCLLRAADYTKDSEFVDMARDALRAYLDSAYDPASGNFFGQVGIRDGRQVVPSQVGYWPRKHADFWSTDQWPAHDYPASAAEACLSLHRLTGDHAFREDIRRWAALAVATAPGRTGRWTYAENYGRSIRFLARAGLALEDEGCLNDARTLADEAVARLWENDLFQGYPESHLYESVDGVGFLIQAFLLLETRRETPWTTP